MGAEWWYPPSIMARTRFALPTGSRRIFTIQRQGRHGTLVSCQFGRTSPGGSDGSCDGVRCGATTRCDAVAVTRRVGLRLWGNVGDRKCSSRDRVSQTNYSTRSSVVNRDLGCVVQVGADRHGRGLGTRGVVIEGDIQQQQQPKPGIAHCHFRRDEIYTSHHGTRRVGIHVGCR